jgi:hypothetical protein
MSGDFLSLIESGQLDQVVLGIEHAVTRSFDADGARMTGAEIRRRCAICERLFRQLRGDLRWGLVRVIDHLPHYLRCDKELSMTKTTKLDTIATRLEEVVGLLHDGDAPARKRMPLSEFMTFALTEIQKAAKDKPELAKRRLATLKRNVDEVIAAIAKLAAEDTESEDVDVEVTTAFAPTKADGDTPMADLTTASDQSSTEVPLDRVSSASGDSAFAENLDQVAKALEKLKADLGASDDAKTRARATKNDAERNERGRSGGARRGGDRGDGGDRGQGRDRDAGDGRGAAGDRDGEGWPLDLASEGFLEGAAEDDTTPLWGYDPDEVASPKAR